MPVGIGDIAVLAAVALLAYLSGRWLWQGHKRGGGCTGNCAGCSGCSGCSGCAPKQSQ